MITREKGQSFKNSTLVDHYVNCFTTSTVHYPQKTHGLCVCEDFPKERVPLFLLWVDK
jgi:hypothetical protein